MLNIILFIFFIFFLFLNLIQNKKKESDELKKVKIKKFPGPINFPIVGALPYIFYLSFKLKDPYKIFKYLTLKYGGIVSCNFSSHRFLLLDDPAIAKEILDWPKRFSNSRLIQARSFGKKLGIIFNNDESHKESRRFTVKTLGQFGFGKKSMETLILEEMKEFLFVFEKRRQEDSTFPMESLFTPSVLNILWGLMASDRFNYEDPRLIELLSMISDASKSEPVLGSLTWLFPKLNNIPGFKMSKMFDLHTRLQKFFQEILNERKMKGHYKYDQDDFIDKFLYEIEARQGTPSGEHYTEEQLIMISIDLFLSGSETLANCLEFAFLYLIEYPEIQKKVFSEIENVVDSELPSLEHRKKMPYSEAFFLEVLRLSNIIPVTVRTPDMEGSYIRGVYVKRGTLACINLTAIHTSKEIWGSDADIFRPERFLDEDGHLVNTKKLLVFGSGMRNCLGESAARLSFFIFLTSLIQRYSFEKSPFHPEPSLKINYGFTNRPHNYHALVKLR